MEFKKGDKIRLTRDYPLDRDGTSSELIYPKGTILTFKDYGVYCTTEEDGRLFYRGDFELVEAAVSDEKLKLEIGEIILELFDFPMAAFSIERTYEKNGKPFRTNLSTVLGSSPAWEHGPSRAFDALRVKSALRACIRSIEMSEWKLTYGPHLEMEQFRAEDEQAHREYMAAD
jgi:hypothetical protein